MDDMISRQAAIDALIEWYGCEPNDMDYFKEILAKKSPAHLTQNNRVNSNNALDTISRQAAIDSIAHATFNVIIGGRRGFQNYKEEFEKAFVGIRDKYVETLKALPSAQPERDIPMKPNETIDSSWGIRKKQAVCPKCDYCLGHVEFIGNPNGKKVTYCETCGQAIDWEGWEWEEE